MEEGKYTDYSAEEFVLDDEFREWVLAPTGENSVFWRSFLEKYPEKGKCLEEAKLIVQSLQPVRPFVPEDRLHDIFRNVRRRGEKNLFKYRGMVAAGITLLIAAGSVVWLVWSRNDPFTLKDKFLSGEKGKIILSDGSIREFDSEKTIIRQMTSGNLTVNNDTIKLDNDDSDKPHKKGMNQIIIPYGKRSELTLSDGTHIWLNSGSRLLYPSVFDSDTREVFLSGEAFFKVSHDKTRPFFVFANEVKVKVLGTKFNISAYREDPVIRTVLLEGKINASRNQLFAKETSLSPGEGITFNKEEGTMIRGQADVRLYTSWIDGYLFFENEPTIEVFKKLERYYNCEIRIDEKLSGNTFSGKLDLSDDIRRVLENISFASSLSVSEQDHVFIIQ